MPPQSRKMACNGISIRKQLLRSLLGSSDPISFPMQPCIACRYDRQRHITWSYIWQYAFIELSWSHKYACGEIHITGYRYQMPAFIMVSADFNFGPEIAWFHYVLTIISILSLPLSVSDQANKMIKSSLVCFIYITCFVSIFVFRFSFRHQQVSTRHLHHHGVL